MKESFEQILDLCLEKVRQGADPEKLIEKYPGYSRELREIFSLVSDIENSGKPDIPEGALQRCLDRMDQAIKEEQVIKEKRLMPVFSPFLVRVAAAAVILVVFLTGLLVFSSKSIPGDMLYPFKILGERMRCCVSISPEGKVLAHCACAQCRCEELRRILVKTGHLDRDIMERMLKIQALVIEDFKSVDQDQREYYRKKIKESFFVQIKALEDILTQASEDEKKMVISSLDLSRMYLAGLDKGF